MKFCKLNVNNYDRFEKTLELFPDFKEKRGHEFMKVLKMSAKYDHNKDLLREAMEKEKQAVVDTS